ncbi:hypothetical protein QBD01_001058 [Ochrobactrum sp. 19YEA23]|uniref:LexA family protein n=1 Tax=Ochrobactrum sp. 19YEA23 TaxID=3039854 RepID=UPI00247A405B|nr:hypothetical protein [Ochrobactrum sp. 19YEA23]
MSESLYVSLLIVISENAYDARVMNVSSCEFRFTNVQRMSKNQRDTKAWIKAVADHLSLSPSRLALNSGSAASTVTRYLNDTSGTIGITQSTLEKIALYSGVPVHRLPGGDRHNPAADVIPLQDHSDPLPEWVGKAAAAIVDGKNGRDAWYVQGWALDLKGILPGDILVVDRQMRPKAGDVVLVRITDFTSGESEDVIRVYDMPFVLTHSAKLGIQKPLVVDDEKVAIVGVSIGTIRPRH